VTATSFTRLVGCALPLQLAGMGGIGNDAALPAAVSAAGGLGMLGAAGVPPDRLASLLETMAEATTGPWGVNFLMPFLDREAVVVAAGGSRLVEFFYGDPDPSLVDLVHDGGALAGWQVGSKDEAVAAASAGCDLIVVQGIEAGGHVRGSQPLAEVLAEALAVLTVPVLAAGGIGTPSQVATLLASGASGVRIGTRFVAARESIAHPQYVDALIEATDSDTAVTTTFSYGWPDAPHRALRAAIEAAEATDDEFVAIEDTGGDHSKVPRFATSPPTNNLRGNVAAMAMYAGTSVSAVRERQPARDIVDELCSLI
jgi:NAD(P)H-dependent flavin oxidoreductase YrpB (nitropropane dioxygenase family)